MLIFQPGVFTNTILVNRTLAGLLTVVLNLVLSDKPSFSSSSDGKRTISWLRSPSKAVGFICSPVRRGHHNDYINRQRITGNGVVFLPDSATASPPPSPPNTLGALTLSSKSLALLSTTASSSYPHRGTMSAAAYATRAKSRPSCSSLVLSHVPLALCLALVLDACIHARRTAPALMYARIHFPWRSSTGPSRRAHTLSSSRSLNHSQRSYLEPTRSALAMIERCSPPHRWTWPRSAHPAIGRLEHVRGAEVRVSDRG